MPTHDTCGREYAKFNKLRMGDFVATDGGFTCLDLGDRLEVKDEGKGLFIDCREGRHYLDGQLDYQHKTDSLIGIYPG